MALPTLTRPTQHKSTPLPPQAAADAAQAISGDGVEVHSFLEAILQIIHASGGSFRCFFCISCSFSHLFHKVLSLRCPVIGLICCYFNWHMNRLIKNGLTQENVLVYLPLKKNKQLKNFL